MRKAKPEAAKPTPREAWDLLRGALVSLESCEGLISVSARALHEQDADLDRCVANVIENHAWPELNRCRDEITKAIHIVAELTEDQAEVPHAAL